MSVILHKTQIGIWLDFRIEKRRTDYLKHLCPYPVPTYSIFYFIVYRILRLVEEKYYFFYFYLRFDQIIFLISKVE